MKKILIMAGAASLLAVAAWAQTANETIAARQTLMREIGQSMKVLSDMAKGEAEFDAATAQAALTLINANAQKLPEMFPKDSQTGTGLERDGVPQETEAAPAIWEKPDEFAEMVDKFINDTASGVHAAPADVKAVGNAMSLFASDCKTCHESFRVDRN